MEFIEILNIWIHVVHQIWGSGAICYCIKYSPATFSPWDPTACILAVLASDSLLLFHSPSFSCFHSSRGHVNALIVKAAGVFSAQADPLRNLSSDVRISAAVLSSSKFSIWFLSIIFLLFGIPSLFKSCSLDFRQLVEHHKDSRFKTFVYRFQHLDQHLLQSLTHSARPTLPWLQKARRK